MGGNLSERTLKNVLLLNIVWWCWDGAQGWLHASTSKHSITELYPHCKDLQCVCLRVHMCAHALEARGQPQLSSSDATTLFSKTGSLIGLGLMGKAKLASWKAPRIFWDYKNNPTGLQFVTWVLRIEPRSPYQQSVHFTTEPSPLWPSVKCLCF